MRKRLDATLGRWTRHFFFILVRAAQKVKTLAIIHKVLASGSSILLFPAGKVRRQPE